MVLGRLLEAHASAAPLSLDAGDHVARVRERLGDELQAAAESGFADQSHMTRAFTRHLGFTPGAWQRAMAQ